MRSWLITKDSNVIFSAIHWTILGRNEFNFSCQ